jgi:hypothetical protein
MITKKPNVSELILLVNELRNQVNSNQEQLEIKNSENKELEYKLQTHINLLEDYLPIIEEWNKKKYEEAIDIEIIISNAKISNRVAFTLWILNSPIVVFITILIITVGIQYITSGIEHPFSLTSSTTWFIPSILAAISAGFSGLSRSYENIQKKGDAMQLSELRRISQEVITAGLAENRREIEKSEAKQKAENDKREAAQKLEQDKREAAQKLEQDKREAAQKLADKKHEAQFGKLIKQLTASVDSLTTRVQNLEIEKKIENASKNN